MIARLQRRSTCLENLSRKYWNARRVIFFGGLLLALFAFGSSGIKVGIALTSVFLATFLLVVFYHRRVLDSITRTALMLKIKQVQLARIRVDWDLLPLSEHSEDEKKRESHPEIAHPFERDLDITGERSLLRLLDSSITAEGSQRLRSWLLSTTPDPLVIEKRQSLVRELTGHALFRDKLQLLSAVASKDSRTSGGWNDPTGRSSRWKTRTLIDWILLGLNEQSLRPILMLLATLAGLNIIFIVLAFLSVIPHVWPIVFLIYVGVMIAYQSRIATSWGELQNLESVLSRFKTVFQYLETRGFRSTPGLAEICADFIDKKKPPSVEARKLERLAAALGLRTNALLWVLVHALVPWDFYFTHRLELIKKDLAQLFPRWLNAWYELEALNSLANFAYLNPTYVFPTIVPLAAGDSLENPQSRTANVFDARKLGHPLLKPEAKVCNDFNLDHQNRIVILTGSNMAGKSTFLRTVGTNLCLAYAGAPVNADSLQTSLFRVFTCINVSDSVQDGLSYFYAEVKRLKALLAATEPGDPRQVLFLIDEIFRGTNSRERGIGSRAYLLSLLQRKAVGLVATHDLELGKLADEISAVVNLHFREEVLEGRMVFDYKLRPGPCPTTNALQIMRLEGLPTEG
jgi:MutS domain V